MTKKLATEELARAYRRVFGSEDGKLVLADIMRVAGVYDVPQTNDHGALAADRGRRELAMHIGMYLTFAPGKFVDDKKSTLEQLGYGDWVN